MTSQTARAKALYGYHDPRWPHHTPLTAEELARRAGERQRHRKNLWLLFGIAWSPKAPHAYRGTPERPTNPRRAEKKARQRESYWAGVRAFNMGGKRL